MGLKTLNEKFVEDLIEIFPEDLPSIYANQPHVSPDRLARAQLKIETEGDSPCGYLFQRRSSAGVAQCIWVYDGHHRLGFAFANGRSAHIRIIRDLGYLGDIGDRGNLANLQTNGVIPDCLTGLWSFKKIQKAINRMLGYESFSEI